MHVQDDTTATPPRINVLCQTTNGAFVGQAYIEPLSVEQEDDGSWTVRIDLWPLGPCPSASRGPSPKGDTTVLA